MLRKIAKQWFLLSLAAAAWCGYAWPGYFAADFPGAFVPAILCHLLQMITGTLTAQHFRDRGSTQEGARE